MADNGIGGRRAVVYVNGQELIRARSIEIDESVQIIRQDCLGDIYSKELVRNGVSVSGRMSGFRFVGQSLKELGIMAGGETLERLLAGSLTIQVWDQVTQQPLEVLTDAKISLRNVSLDANSLMTEDISFEAIRSRTGELGL